MACIHAAKAVIWGKESRTCTHKRDNSGNSAIISEENWFDNSRDIGLHEINLDMHFDGQLM